MFDTLSGTAFFKGTGYGKLAEGLISRKQSAEFVSYKSGG